MVPTPPPKISLSLPLPIRRAPLLTDVPKWSPLAEGHLARPLGAKGGSVRSQEGSRFGNGQSEADQAIIQRVQQIATARGCTMSQVALAWLSKRVTAMIVGMHSIERMDEALGIRGLTLNEQEEAYLEEPYEPKRIQGHS
jgi:aryl-alcohol dehydrogenase-like predicted oxidoreductase